MADAESQNRSCGTRVGKVHDIVIRPIRQWRLLNVAEIWFHRDLLLMLVIRSIKLRYKQTAIGLAWVVLQPLLSAMILAIVFGRLGGLPSEGAPYVLVVYTGMLPWIIISQTIQRGGVSIVSDRGLVTNIYFPRAILPIAHCLSVLVDYTVATLFMLILMMIYGQSFGWAILTLPVLTAVALLLAFGIVLVISAVNVYFRDVMHALPSQRRRFGRVGGIKFETLF